MAQVPTMLWVRDHAGIIAMPDSHLAIAIASLLASIAAVLIARNGLSQAKQVADRDQKDWRQRKWFDLYFKSDEAYDALDKFQTLYPSTSSQDWDTNERRREYNDLMSTIRTVHRVAVVFPKDQVIQALLDATAAFANEEEATSKERLNNIMAAVEGIRKKALIYSTVLD